MKPILISIFILFYPILSSGTTCEPSLNIPGGDLVSAGVDTLEQCIDLCLNNTACNIYTVHYNDCTYDSTSCGLANQHCCYLKHSEISGVAPKINNCTCSGYVRVPQQSVQEKSTSPRNVLYILVDDLRPELEAYGQAHHSPNINKLAQTGTVFDNAYCQIAVCSPSRMSFMTGRRPDHSHIYNFINHFRQSDCGLTQGNVAHTGNVLETIDVDWTLGASGQCCTVCTEHAACVAWSYHTNNSCILFDQISDPSPASGAVSGVRGSFQTHANWTSLPQHFKNNGFLTLATGKTFHTEEGGVGSINPDLNGAGFIIYV